MTPIEKLLQLEIDRIRENTKILREQNMRSLDNLIEKKIEDKIEQLKHLSSNLKVLDNQN